MDMRSRRGLVATGFAAVVIAVAGLRGRLRRYEIAESSMEPALWAGDYVMARRVEAALVRGDIIVIPHPEMQRFDLVKRLIGMPGETVNIAGGQVHIDGVTLAEPWAQGPVRPDGEWRLGPDEVFVLGDNRAISAADSRTIGPVGRNAVRWRVVARYWPPSRIGRL
jgi:signal peptidase I